jgi:AcrR family transcriptional regulator
MRPQLSRWKELLGRKRADPSAANAPLDTGHRLIYIEQVDKPVVQTKKPASRTGPRRPARPPRSDGVSTRALILEATRHRLIEDGYARLNVRDIAADAGVNHALIGYHFQGKQQLVLAVLDEANTRLLERQSRMYDSPLSGTQKWRQACDFYEEDLASGFVKLLMELMGASFHDEPLRREFTPRLLAWQKLIEMAVDQFTAENRLDLPISSRSISAWITYFWIGMEASMALGIKEAQGHQREALSAMGALLAQVEARAPAVRKTRRRA